MKEIRLPDRMARPEPDPFHAADGGSLYDEDPTDMAVWGHALWVAGLTP